MTEILARNYPDNRWQIPYFTISEIRYLPEAELPNHCHETASISMVLAGSCSECYERQTIECAPSTLLFRPSGHMHSNRIHTAGTKCINVEIDERWLNRARATADIIDYPAVFRGGLLPSLAGRLYDEFSRRDSVSPLIIEGLTLEILAEATRGIQPGLSRGAPGWLEKVKELLHRRFTENLDLATIAESAGVHPVHMASTFRKHYRCSVGEYVRHLRIEFACRLLATSKVPIAVLSLKAGFADQSHFSKSFKRVTGLSPARYRRIHAAH